jgi:hypothetical protein
MSRAQRFGQLSCRVRAYALRDYLSMCASLQPKLRRLGRISQTKARQNRGLRALWWIEQSLSRCQNFCAFGAKSNIARGAADPPSSDGVGHARPM